MRKEGAKLLPVKNSSEEEKRKKVKNRGHILACHVWHCA
jgi:hypothetical protein